MRVVIGEDQALLRQGIVSLLGAAGFEVVAEAGDAPDLLRKVAAHKPDVAIVDVQMPPDNTDDGLRAAMEIRASQPSVGVLVLSQFAEERYAVDLIGDNAAGVGYLLKDRVTDFKGFAEAVRRVGVGGSVLDPTVVAHMFGRRRRDDPLEKLTPREREVLEYMAEGRSNKGIAEKLVVTPHAVEKHVTSLFSKLEIAAGPEDHRRVLAVLEFLRRRYARWDAGAHQRAGALRAGDLEGAVERADAVAEATQACALAGLRAADAVVADVDHGVAVLAPDLDAGVRRVRVLGDVRQRLGDDEVGRRLHRAGQALGERAVEFDGHRGAAGQRFERRVQSALGEHRGMDARGQIAQLLHRLLRVGERAVDELLGAVRVRVERLAGELELDHQRDEPLLGAVVQVPA